MQPPAHTTIITGIRPSRAPIRPRLTAAAEGRRIPGRYTRAAVPILRLLSLTALSAVSLELCARSVARRSMVEAVAGVRPELGTIVLVAVLAAIAGIAAARHEARRWRTAFVFAALFAAGVAAQLHLGARLQSDGFYYFAYLRSIAFDRDVEFTNDYKLLGLGDKAHLFNPTPTGYAQSAWTIGPAIVWAPFFAAAHPIAARLAAGGADVSTNGISYPYRQAVCIAGLFYAPAWLLVHLPADHALLRPPPRGGRRRARRSAAPSCSGTSSRNRA